jgi:hypothetical protein
MLWAAGTSAAIASQLSPDRGRRRRRRRWVERHADNRLVLCGHCRRRELWAVVDTVILCSAYSRTTVVGDARLAPVTGSIG